MQTCAIQNKTRTLLIALICLFIPSSIFAVESFESLGNKNKTSGSLYAFFGKKEKKIDLTNLKEQAQYYRQQGLIQQRLGDLDKAMGFYQKAVALDPACVIAYNDLGIIYEMKGMQERAEQSYLQAIKLDPNFSSSYSNLALLYESRRNLEEALLYWKKRAELGQIEDPWTQKARQRCEDITVLLKKDAERRKYEREHKVINLMKEVAKDKAVKQELATKKEAVSKKNEESLKQKESQVEAQTEEADVQYLDPANEEVKEFVEGFQRETLSE